jgi:hypothetical protein
VVKRITEKYTLLVCAAGRLELELLHRAGKPTVSPILVQIEKNNDLLKEMKRRKLTKGLGVGLLGGMGNAGCHRASTWRNTAAETQSIWRLTASEGERLFKMLTGFGSFCDEFGSPKDPNKTVMGIAGLLAWSDDWIALSEKWREIQSKEKVPTFHMTDFVHQTENFKDSRWKSAAERGRILGLFLHTIASAKAIPVAAAVVLKDFNWLCVDQRKKLVRPYHVCFQEVTFNLAFAADV